MSHFNSLINTITMAMKAKVMPLFTKIRMWTSPAFLRGRVLNQFREFLRNLFDVKPRSAKDYYPFLRWLVSKRLAFAVVVILGILSVFYIAGTLPANMGGQGTGLKTYKYRAIPLRFYEGEVNILDRNGEIGYTGQVKAGFAEGQGTLYDTNGKMVYKGQFANSMYNGQGELYYPSGVPRYKGDFANNLFHGVGSYSRPSGVKEYTGDFVNGQRSGHGTLFNSTGDEVYDGNFLADEIVYSDLLDRPTQEISQIYTGEEIINRTGDESCVSMPDIDAVCALHDGSESLEGEWKVSDVLVLDDHIQLEGQQCTTVKDVSALLGQPHYFGSSPVTLAEATAINLLDGKAAEAMGRVEMDTKKVFDEVVQVDDYDAGYEVYLYSYIKDGLLYTFYAPGAGMTEFMMYSIAKA